MTVDEILDGVLEREKGYVNNPADRGGPTKYGITQATLSSWLGRAATVAEVEALAPDQAREIYRARYYVGPGIDRIVGAPVQVAVVDCAVLHGPRTAIQLLQRALGVKDDGIIGTGTAIAAAQVDARKLARLVLAQQTRLYGRIISGNLTDRDRDGIPDNVEMAAGWLDRNARLQEQFA